MDSKVGKNANFDQQRKVVIFGANIRSLAKSALEAGWQVRGFDLFSDWDSRQVCEVAKLDGFGEILHQLEGMKSTECICVTGGFEATFSQQRQTPRNIVWLNTSVESFSSCS